MNVQKLKEHYANTTVWAATQDKIFRGEEKPEKAFEFETLRFAQELICPSNLTIRQHLIMRIVTGNDWHLHKACQQFETLRKNGYWKESASYWEYTCKGWEWAEKQGIPFPSFIPITREWYALLAAPDGSIPLPECGLGGWSNPEPEDLVATPNYYCKRWFDGDRKVVAYLLISLDNDPEPRLNGHHHLEAGYFAFWQGEFKTRSRPYTGFNFEDSFESRALAETLPKGAILPLWRSKPPKVTVAKTELGYSFKWDNGFGRWNAQRIIEICPDRVVVKDCNAGFFQKEKMRTFYTTGEG